MSGTQRGAIVGGTWLIALGAVFLVQQLAGLPWSRAWPLFIIMLGVGTAVSSVVGVAGRRAGPWTVLWALAVPTVVIIVGVLLFVDLAGLADIDAFGLLARWWPLGLVALGLLVLAGAVWPRGRGVEESLRVPAAGVTSGEVILKFGAGQLDVGPGSPGVLVDGTFEGGVVRRDLGPGRVELQTDIAQVVPWVGQRVRWNVRLAPDLPLSLRLEGGASRSVLDLTELEVTALTVKTGASDTRILLPRSVAQTEVRVDAGAAEVRIEVPEGVAARIRSQVALGTTRVDERRFPRDGGGWISADYPAAAHRADIVVQGGVGTISIA